MAKAKQIAALPIRKSEDGSVQVMLVTSRETQRYVIPKGWPWPGRKDHQSAVREAHEEAGIVGTVRRRSIGSYTYKKRFPDGSIPVRVKVFLLVVEELLETWPEIGERKRAWFTPAKAAKAVDEAELAMIINSLASVL